MGTISNQEGYFSLKLPAKSKTTTLTISHIAYAIQQIPVKSGDDLKIELVEDFTSLEEIVVKSSAGTMAREIYEMLEQASGTLNFGKAFYRQVSEKDTLPTEWIESFVTLSYNTTGLSKMAVEQARVAETRSRSRDDLHLSLTNFTYLSFFPLYAAKQSLVATPFSKVYFDDYNFYIEEEYTKGAESVVKLAFNPTDELEAVVKSYGSLLYNLDQKKLMQMTVIMDHNLGLTINTDHLDKEAALKNPQYRFAFEFSQVEDNRPEVVHVTFTTDIQYGETLSPHVTKSTLIIYEPNTKRSKKLYRPTIDNNFYEEFKQAKYRPAFWRDNPVIRRTAEEERIIQVLESAGAFGTYFKGKR